MSNSRSYGVVHWCTSGVVVLVALLQWSIVNANLENGSSYFGATSVYGSDAMLRDHNREHSLDSFENDTYDHIYDSKPSYTRGSKPAVVFETHSKHYRKKVVPNQTGLLWSLLRRSGNKTQRARRSAANGTPVDCNDFAGSCVDSPINKSVHHNNSSRRNVKHQNNNGNVLSKRAQHKVRLNSAGQTAAFKNHKRSSSSSTVTECAHDTSNNSNKYVSPNVHSDIKKQRLDDYEDDDIVIIENGGSGSIKESGSSSDSEQGSIDSRYVIIDNGHDTGKGKIGVGGDSDFENAGDSDFENAGDSDFEDDIVVIPEEE